jgi:hypothetical protein
MFVFQRKVYLKIDIFEIRQVLAMVVFENWNNVLLDDHFRERSLFRMNLLEFFGFSQIDRLRRNVLIV